MNSMACGNVHWSHGGRAFLKLSVSLGLRYSEDKLSPVTGYALAEFSSKVVESLVFPVSSGFGSGLEPFFALAGGVQRKMRGQFSMRTASATVPLPHLPLCDVRSSCRL